MRFQSPGLARLNAQSPLMLVVLGLALVAAACGSLGVEGEQRPAENEGTPFVVPSPPPDQTSLVLDPAVVSSEDVPAEGYSSYEVLVDEVIASVIGFWDEWFAAAGQRWEAPLVYEQVEAETGLLCGEARRRARGSYFCRPDKYIALDEEAQLLPLYLQVGPYAVAMVIAHEAGHAVQLGLGQEFDEDDMDEKERQADCFAGAWLRHHQEEEGFPDNSEPFSEAYMAMRTVDDGQELRERYQELKGGFENGPDWCIKEFPVEVRPTPITPVQR